MLLTHEEARRLIQLEIDKALGSDHKIALAAHLIACSKCRAYAEDIREVDRVLAPVLKRQWNLQPLPLSIGALTRKRIPKLQPSILLATRTALIGVMFIAFVFSAWQFMLSGPGSPGQIAVSAVPVSTPSLQLTTTRTVWEDCEIMAYTVQENDTLESLARRFSVSKEEIMALNEVQTETVNPRMQLLVPLCTFTPTGTVEGPTLFSTTYTPLLSPTTTTPGPGG